jgi:hypothetical protein
LRAAGPNPQILSPAEVSVLEVAMPAMGATLSPRGPDDHRGSRWTGEVEIDQEILVSVAETFSRLYRCGWSTDGIAVSFNDGSCVFAVRGRIGEDPIYAEGATLVEALRQAWGEARMLNVRRSSAARVAVV